MKKTKDNNRHHDEGAAWSWYSLERSPHGTPALNSLAHQVGGRLRVIYPADRDCDEPPAIRQLIAALQAKGM